MIEWIIRTSSPAEYLDREPPYHSVGVVGASGFDDVVRILHPTDPVIAGDTLISQSDPENSVVQYYDSAEWNVIRPWGNSPEYETEDSDGNPVVVPEGQATQNLDYPRYDWPDRQRKFGDAQNPDVIMRLYPASDAPYAIEMRPKEFGSTWGWRCEVVGGVESRDIASRQMRGTGGGQAFPFTRKDSEWYFDDDGNPLQTWSAEHDENINERTNIELACRYQGKNEGYWEMLATDERVTRLFWSHTQGQAQTQSGPFRLNAEKSFIVDYERKRVEINVNGDPEPEVTIPIAALEARISDPEWLRTIRSRLV